ncbi:MAG: peptidoglycan DD-metalloendopeptidase family protein [Chloroflexota bacterium]|nr:peptidoglycan DD-metalloendopeptidase family protein [Chloroflexota bacterium]
MSTFPPPVPKPANAGAPKTALALTTGAYINIRNGPATNYRDIGDLRRNTLVAYYPQTLKQDGWIWIEQAGVGGWVLTYVVRFEDVAAQLPPAPNQVTPFDGKVGMWHWRGDMLGENSIDELARNLRNAVPELRQIYVKTSDITQSAGAQWQGYWDTKRALAIDGPASIDRWVSGLARHNMEFVAWCIPRGINVAAEADLIIQACQRPGVRAMILDVEPYEGFWVGGREAVRPLMIRVRRALPGSFHIGLCIDPRRRWFDAIHPQEWAPFVNSVHTMSYWQTFGRSPEEVLQETFEVWGPYGKPIIPALQGDAPVAEITEAGTLAINRHRARSVSWWRLGVMTPPQLRAAGRALGTNPGTQPPPPTIEFGETQVVRPTDPGFASFTFTGRNEFSDFVGSWGWKVLYKATETQQSKVTGKWTPRIAQSGRQEISVFVPARHATTTNARYKIHGVRGTTGEVQVTVNQALQSNSWVTLGIYDIDRTLVNAGVVFLNDLTGEADKEIAFDAVRWRAIIDRPIGGGDPSPFAGDGYDSPVGTQEERRGTRVWPGRWLDASPFGRLYFVGTPSEAYHTGADLNLPQDADRGAPVYACASGVVVFAARLPTWGNVIVIKHDPLATTGQVMYSRYGHVGDMLVGVGARVRRGQQISIVSNAFGRWAFHLHFDLSPTTILETEPSHWPGRDREETFRHYVDPREYIANNRPRA